MNTNNIICYTRLRSNIIHNCSDKPTYKISTYFKNTLNEINLDYNARQKRLYTIITAVKIIQEAINNKGIYSCELDFNRLDEELLNNLIGKKDDQYLKQQLEIICTHRYQLFKNKKYNFPYCNTTNYTRSARELINAISQFHLTRSTGLP